MNDEQEPGPQRDAPDALNPMEPGSHPPSETRPAGGAPQASEAPKSTSPIGARNVAERDRATSPRSSSRTGSADKKQPPLRWGELIGVLCLVVLCDLTIYRGEGLAGYALLFLVAPLLLWLSSNWRCRGPAFWIVSAMLAALAGRTVWCGSGLNVVVGFGLIAAFAMTLVGSCPYVLDTVFFTLRTLHAGYHGMIQYGSRINTLLPVLPRAGWMNVVLPLMAFLLFGWIFVLANPDLTVWFGEGLRGVFDVVKNWVDRFSPDLLEAGFWLAALWVVVGLLRPSKDRSRHESSPEEIRTFDTPASTDASLYPALRNTLITVIVLFAVYLVFEFKTLWFRDFPSGFHYSGYAHEGAAWLTAALALATVILSLVFRGHVLREHRIGSLRRLAWLWSIENMLLAAAVYNRLFIYIGFNGMSRMRIVALYGMSAVVVGFMLVVWKIVHDREFLWLVRRHLWTLAIAVYLFALTPVDAIVSGYNVRRILDGDPAPSVQISVHPINSEGLLMLEPLLECDDEVIRDGVRALLAEHHREAEATATVRSELGWTTYQAADHVALKELRKNSEQWKPFADADSRRSALDRFHKYAYQWY